MKQSSHLHLSSTGVSRRERTQTLLLIDDDSYAMNALVRVLRRNGYRILTATCAEEAFAVLEREDVQVVISDQGKPGRSGTEVLSKVQETHPRTVRMLLSGYAGVSAVAEAFNRGAIYRTIAKPWDDEDLALQVEDAFRAHEADKRN